MKSKEQKVHIQFSC